MTSAASRAFGGATVIALVLTANAAAAQQLPQATAVGFDANFRSGDVATELGPIAHISGPAGGKFDAWVEVPIIDRSLAMAPKTPTPTFFLNATRLKSHVSGGGAAADYRGVEGDNALATAALSLNIYPLPPAAAGQPTPYPPLAITAEEVVSSADYSVSAGGSAFATGATRIGALTLSGPLVGGKVLRFSGQIAPNTIAFQSASVTITLNRQLRAGIISCSPGCTFTPTSIDVTAIDVELDNADVYGTRVSGDIQINHATAR